MSLRPPSAHHAESDGYGCETAEDLAGIGLRVRAGLPDRVVDVDAFHLIADRANARRVDTDFVQYAFQTALRTIRNGHTGFALVLVELIGGIHCIDHQYPPFTGYL